MRVMHQLITVTVAGDDDDVVTAGLALFGDGGDDVVGFPTDQFQLRHAERGHDFANETHLLAQDVGRGFPLRFVRWQCLMPKRWFRPIERHHDSIGLVILHQVDEHGGETEHRVGDLPRRRRHVGREREERSVGERIAIENHQPGHG